MALVLADCLADMKKELKKKLETSTLSPSASHSQLTNSVFIAVQVEAAAQNPGDVGFRFVVLCGFRV